MVAMNLRGEAIKDRDLMATAQKLSSDTRSDETSTARDKHSILQISLPFGLEDVGITHSFNSCEYTFTNLAGDPATIE